MQSILDYKFDIVLIGWDSFAEKVSEQIVNAEKNILVITNNEKYYEMLKRHNVGEYLRVIMTDYNEFDELKALKVDSASSIFINFMDDTELLIYIVNLNKYFSGLNIVVSIQNPDLKKTFDSAGVKYALSREEIDAKIMASHLFEPDVAHYLGDMLTTAITEEEYDIQQFRVIEGNPFLNWNYGNAFFELKERYNAVLIGLGRIEEQGMNLQKNPPDDTLINKGDYLILILSGSSSAMIRRDFGVDEGI